MAALTCPKCSAAIHAHEKLPQRCERCGAALHCCRYCTHFDHRVLDCAHPDLVDIEHITDADDVRSCRYFSFNPRITTAKTFLSLSISMWMSAIALIVLGGLLYIGLTRTSTGAPLSALQLNVQPPGTIVREDPCDISFSIVNNSQATARNVMITVEATTLSALDYTQSQPVPRRVDRRGKSMNLVFGDVAAGQTITGSISFTPKRTGTIPIGLMLSAENIDKPSLVNTQIQITP
jgi:hypothetical protein